MAILDFTKFDPALKENYSNDKVENLVTRKSPLLSMIPRAAKFYGDVYVLPFRTSNPQGIISGVSNFAAGIAVESPSELSRMLVTSTQHYQFAKVLSEVWYASKDPDGAFLNALESELDAAYEEFGRDFGKQIYRTKKGLAARIASYTSGAIVMTKSRDIKLFSLGMRVMASPNADGSSPRSGTGVISAIDYDAGTMSITDGTITSIAANDYLFRALTNDYCLSGLQEWMPSAGVASFFGLDTRVSSQYRGMYKVASGNTIEEAFIDMITELRDNESAADVVMCDSVVYARLQKEMAAQKIQMKPAAKVAELGFKSIEMADGTAIVMDPFCPTGEAFFLDLNTWLLIHRGEWIHMVEDNTGSIWDKISNNDGVQVRLRSYCQLICKEPHKNGRLVGLDAI